MTTPPTCGRPRRLQVDALDLRLDDPTGFVARVESWLATLPAGRRPA